MSQFLALESHHLKKLTLEVIDRALNHFRHQNELALLLPKIWNPQTGVFVMTWTIFSKLDQTVIWNCPRWFSRENLLGLNLATMK